MDFTRLNSAFSKTVLSITTVALILQGCSTAPEPEQPKQPKTKFVPVNFSKLHGWNTEQAVGLRQALIESCKVYSKRSGPISKNYTLYGTYEQWQPICAVLPKLALNELMPFFQNRFSAYQINPEESGLFTGYFTPLLHGSRTPSNRYNVPLLKRPGDLVQFNPADFGLENSDPKRTFTTLSGKIINNQLVPYDSRATINARAKRGEYNNDVLFWLDDRVDRFFLEIQGSGTIRLNTGEDVQVGYDSRNGHKYYAIGRYLKRNGLLEQVSMDSIREWLANNPDRLDEVLHTNPNFIFFSKLDKPGPLGAQGTRLIPGHSVAVDTRYIPLGTPLWVDTIRTRDNTPFQHGMVAQDIGSAIRGAVRADIFFGAGDRAGELAGYQNAQGALYVMVPRIGAKE